ncbi:hypothetical protein ACROYT_G012718 [Oculina patagonica]
MVWDINDALATTAITPTVKTNATNSSVSTTQSTTPPGPPPTTEPRTEPRTEPTVKPSTSPSEKTCEATTVFISPSATVVSNSSSTLNATTPTPPPPPSSVANISSIATTGPRPSEKTCAKLGVIVNVTWDKIFQNNSSDLLEQAVRKLFSDALTMLYTGKHDDVLVSEVKFTEKDKMVFAKGKLCLVFNDDADFIEDVFKKKVETGELRAGFPVIKGSAEFEAVGVSFKDWKAKEGECKKCEEGGGGPIIIVRTCQVETEGLSCKGLKTTKKSDDCVEYCPSSSTAITVSSLVLAIGIFLSFSFQ